MISVCIPTYNGGRFIVEQLVSILKQLDSTDEVVISDDSSTDNTVQLIKSFNDKRIRLFENNNFKSPIFNMENALKNAQGDYIFTADQDDIWTDNKIKIMMQHLFENDLIVSDCMVIDNDKKILEDSFFKLNRSKKGFAHNFVKNSFLGCCMAFDRGVLNYVLPFPKNIAMHDIWIGLNAELIGKTKFINDKLIYYRRHDMNFSNASEKSTYSLKYKIIYRIEMLILIAQRWLTHKSRKAG